MIIESARSGRASLSPLIVPVFLVAVFANIGWHVVAIVRTSRTSS